MKTCAIMQPTFLPWAGYFDMIDSVDVFVYLDTVAYSARSWQQRNRIKTPAGLTWLTLPVTASRAAASSIVEAQVAEGADIRKLRSALAHAYARAPHRDAELAWIDAALAAMQPGQSLAEATIGFIEAACQRLAIATPRVRASALPAQDGRTERLAGIAHALDCTHYLAAPGSAAYLQQERPALDAAGIRFAFHAYAHPVWRQLHGPFLSHASVVDLILNEGPGAAAILRSGRIAPVPACEMFARLDQARPAAAQSA